jgi:hypothetical protein
VQLFVLWIIAASEIIGSVVMLGACCVGVWAFGPSTFLGHIFPGLVIALFTLTAGIQLLRLRPAGRKLSAWAQALQIPYIASHWVTYKVVLGLSMLVWFNIKSGMLMFQAQFGDMEWMVFVPDDGSRAVGINVLAIALWSYLMRVRFPEAGEKPRVDTRKMPRASLPRRILRFVAISVMVLLAIVLIPTLGLWIYNRFDETPTPAAQRWYAPATHTLADRDNAWLAMLGIGAADGDDPIALGRRWLDAHEARLARGGLPPESEEEKALAVPALPFDDKGADGEKFDLFCDGGTRDCIAWTREEAGNLARIEAANAVRMRRYESVLGLNGFEALDTPSIKDLYPTIGADDALYRAIILRDFGIPSKRADALARLSRGAAFWQRADGAANSVTLKMLSSVMLERYLRTFEAVFDHAGERDSGAIDTLAGVVLEPMTPAQKDWQPALRNGTLAFDFATRKSVLANPVDAYRYCDAHCFKMWIIAQFYEPHATQNLGAKLWDAILAVHQADPRNLDALQKRVSELFDEIFPLQESAAETARRMAYNATGRVLVLQSLPAYADYMYRHHDVEGLRRLLQIKVMALKQHVRAADMPKFLEAQPQELRDVYSDNAFAWDAASHEMRFAVKSKKWKREYFAVAYPKA